MENLLRRGLCVLLIVSLGGCETFVMPQIFTPTAPPNLSESQLAEYSEDFNRTIIEGMLIGAAGGAAIGAVVSSSAEGKDLGLSILIGSIVGAAVGGLGGYYVAMKKGDYANEYALLEAMRKDVHAHNTHLKTYISLAQKVRVENEIRLSRMRKELIAGTVDVSEYERHLSRVEVNHREIANAISDLKARETDYLEASQGIAQDYPNVRIGKFQQEILELQEQIAMLEQEHRMLGAVLEVSQLG